MSLMGSTIGEESMASVFALLKVISDPEKHRAALAEMQTRLDNNAKILAEARAAQDKIEQAKRELEQAGEDHKSHIAVEQGRLARISADVETARRALSRDLDDLAVKQRQLSDHDAAIAKRHADTTEYEQTQARYLDGRESDLRARESLCAEKESDLAALEKKVLADAEAVETLRADLEGRLIKLRALAGDPVNYSMTAETGKIGASFGKGG